MREEGGAMGGEEPWEGRSHDHASTFFLAVLKVDGVHFPLHATILLRLFERLNGCVLDGICILMHVMI